MSGNFDDWGARLNAQQGWGRMYGADPTLQKQKPAVVKPIVMTAPEIKYEKIPLPYGPVAAAAEMNKDSMRGLIVMGQKNNESVKVDVRLAGLSKSTEYELRIQDYGNILSNCSLCGEVFNPLMGEDYETFDSWGRKIQMKYEQDGRGAIESFHTDANGEVQTDGLELLQNLSGDDNLIGKSVVLYEKDDSSPIMCGVIGHGLPEAEILTFDD